MSSRPSCSGCGTTWRQAGNRTGHCTACHCTFDSHEAFDAHQRIEAERNVCSDPATLTRRDGAPMLEPSIRDGVTYWRRAREPKAWPATSGARRVAPVPALPAPGLPLAV